jgi:Glu-tRNA(Gln) amidotransferase subunit E-like FAD-binding protein
MRTFALALFPLCLVIGCKKDEARPAAAPKVAAEVKPAEVKPADAPRAVEAPRPTGAARVVELKVTAEGFQPGNVTLKKDEPVKFVVTRVSDETCATELLIAGTDIKAELPLDKRRRYVSSWGLPMAQAGTIVDDVAVAAAFEASCALAPGHERAVANWVCNDVAALAIEGQTVSPVALARLVVLIESGAVAGKDAKALLRVLAETATTEAAAVDRLVDERGLRLQQGDDVVDALRAIVAAVCSEYPTQVADVRAGKDKVKGFLVGQVLKRAGKGIDPKLAQQLVDAAIAGGST